LEILLDTPCATDGAIIPNAGGRTKEGYPLRRKINFCRQKITPRAAPILLWIFKNEKSLPANPELRNVSQ